MNIPISQRIISILIYMLPWSEALPFGSHLFNEFDLFKLLIIPALPIIFIQRLIPFGNIILYIACFICVIRNPKVSYYIRFNMLQAILINIILIIVSLIFQILSQSLSYPLLTNTFSSTVLLMALSIIIFSIIECFKGKEPDLPGISNSVRIQL